MLASLNNLEAERVLEQHVGVGGVIDEVDDGVVGDELCAAFDNLVIVVGDCRNVFV